MLAFGDAIRQFALCVRYDHPIVDNLLFGRLWHVVFADLLIVGLGFGP